MRLDFPTAVSVPENPISRGGSGHVPRVPVQRAQVAPMSQAQGPFREPSITINQLHDTGQVTPHGQASPRRLHPKTEDVGRNKLNDILYFKAKATHVINTQEM